MFLVVLSLVSVCLYLYRTKSKFFICTGYLALSVIIIVVLNGTHFTDIFFMSKFGNTNIWAETVTYDPADILFPKNITSLKQVVRDCTKCRVVGSRHSFSPLIVTDDTQIDLKYITGLISDTGSEVTFWSGTTIEEVMVYLTQLNRTLHGIGSIHSQTLGGALSTALVGVQRTSFSSHVSKVVTLDSQGNEVIWNDPYYVRNSMGMIGVIIKVTMRTFPNKATEHVLSQMTIPQIISYWESSDFIASDSSFTIYDIKNNMKVPVVHNYISDKSFETQYPLYWNINDYISFELLVAPLSWFIYVFSHSTLKIAINPQDREVALLGVDREQYGFTYTDYTVPLQNCTAALQDIAEISKFNPLIRMKYLHEYNKSCFDPTQAPSCRLELYESHSKHDVYSFVDQVQNIIFKHGGFVHWGKLYIGNITKQLQRFQCYDSFEQIRQYQDPTNKFINNYLQGASTQYNTYGSRKWIFGIYLLFSIPLIIFYFKIK